MFRRIVGVAVLAAAVGAKAQEPPMLFGIAFNQPLAMPECEWKTREKLRFSRKEPKTMENYYTSMWPKEGNCYKRPMNKVGSTEPLNNETVSIEFPLSKQPTLGNYVAGHVVGGRLQRLWLTTGGISTQERDLQLLKEKFGQPATLLTPKQQNRMGATFDTIEAEWKLPGDITATYGSAVGKITEGTFIVATPAGQASYQQAMDAILNRGTQL